MTRLVMFLLTLTACSSSSTNEDGLFGGSSGYAGQSAGGAAGSVTTGGGAGAAGGGAAGVDGGCVPQTCESLGYQCGAANSDGCGGTLVCGPAYARHPEEDWPAMDAEGHGCTSEQPYSWACGAFPSPGGDAPFTDCVRWFGSATWCCAQP